MKVRSVVDCGERFIVVPGGCDGSERWLSVSEATRLRDKLSVELNDGPDAALAELEAKYMAAESARADLEARVADLESDQRHAIVALLRIGRLTGALRDEPWPDDLRLPDAIAERLEAPLREIELHERTARNVLAEALIAIDGLHSSSLADCATRAAELLRDPAERVSSLRTALRSLIARIRSVGGYATPEEQDVLREAERVAGGDPCGWPGWVAGRNAP